MMMLICFCWVVVSHLHHFDSLWGICASLWWFWISMWLFFHFTIAFFVIAVLCKNRLEHFGIIFLILDVLNLFNIILCGFFGGRL